MKDPIQQSGQEVSIVIYDAPLPPRYLRFSKKFIKTLFVAVPICLGLIFAALFLWGLGSRMQEVPTPKLPEIVIDKDSKVAELESELEAIKQSNTQLQDKLSAQIPPDTQESPYLMAIKKPYGMQNFLNENRVSLDQFELVRNQNKTALKFQIISNKAEQKVTGHVLVFMLSETGMMAYPQDANASIGMGIKYSMGEPFSVSRLRPTNAEFNQHVTGETIKFVIYIFTREGDLLLIKETESYKIGPKS